MARVVVIGPNLSGQQSRKDYSSFHVHAEGCADIYRSPLYKSREYDYDKNNVVDYANVVEIAADVYSDHIDEEQTAESLVNEFRVFPCVHFAPEKVTIPGTNIKAYAASALPVPPPFDSPKEETTMVTVTFELFKDGLFFNLAVECTKANLDETLSEIFAMKNSRAIQY